MRASGFAPERSSSSTIAVSPKSMFAAHSSGVIPCLSTTFTLAPRVDQHARHLEIVVETRAPEHRDAVAVGEVDRRAEIEQRARDLDVAELERAQHRCRARRADRDHRLVEFAPRREQALEALRIAGIRGQEERIGVEDRRTVAGGATCAPRSSSRLIAASAS